MTKSQSASGGMTNWDGISVTVLDGALRDPSHRPGRAGTLRHGAGVPSLGPAGCPTIIGH